MHTFATEKVTTFAIGIAMAGVLYAAFATTLYLLYGANPVTGFNWLLPALLIVTLGRSEKYLNSILQDPLSTSPLTLAMLIILMCTLLVFALLIVFGDAFTNSESAALHPLLLLFMYAILSEAAHKLLHNRQRQRWMDWVI